MPKTESRLGYAEGKIPVTKSGDPAFLSLEQVLQVLKPEDVTWLVNRALYALGYQKAYHRKKAEAEKELRDAVRKDARVRALFGDGSGKAVDAEDKGR